MQYRDPDYDKDGSLIRKMRALAKTSSPVHSTQLEELATKLEQALQDCKTAAHDDVVLNLAYAKGVAITYYCNLTGEPLI